MRLARAITPLALLAATLGGCAFTTGHVDLRYEPAPDRKSPLSTIPPRVVTVKVEDARPATERDRVGDKRNNLGTVTAHATPHLGQPASATVRVPPLGTLWLANVRG